MTTYLVDYENASYHGLSGFKKLDPTDTVVIFLGAKSSQAKMPIEVVKELNPLGGPPRLIWKQSKKTSKNYLDLQLVSYLGYLIGDPGIAETNFVIVSKDHDFEAAIDFWAERRRDIAISLRPTIATVESTPERREANVTRAIVVDDVKKLGGVSEATRRAVRSAVKGIGLKPSEYSTIYQAFAASKTSQELHTKLSSGLKANGQKVYPLVKEIHAKLVANK